MRLAAGGVAIFLHRLVLYVSLAVIAAAFVASLFFPLYGAFIFYGLLAWLLISFGIGRMPGVGRRRAGRPVGTPPAPAAPAPTGTGAAPAREPLGFCIYCGTLLAEGAAACPSCGRSVGRA